MKCRLLAACCLGALIAAGGMGAPRPAAAEEAIDAVCGSSRWQALRLGQGQAGASVYLLEASRDRLYAAAQVGGGATPSWQTFGAGFDATGLSQLSTLEGRRLSDLLSTPAHRDTVAWASGFGDSNVFGALGSSPTGFAARGTLTAWPARLMSTGLEVFTLATRVGANPGVYRWDASLGPSGDWVRSSGDVVDAGGQAVRAAWASGTDATGRMWLGTDRAGLWTSSDGALWERRGSSPSLDLAFSTITAIASSGAEGRSLAVGLGPSVVVPPSPGSNSSRGVLVSRDGGFSFGNATYPGLLPALSDEVTDLAFSPSRPELLFASVWGEGLWLSRDGGVTWLHLGVPAGSGSGFGGSYVKTMALVQSALKPGCEMLFIGGADGLWVRDAARIGSGARIYLPTVNRGNPNPAVAVGAKVGPPSWLERRLPAHGR